jgi:hypothetical protein
MPHIKALFDPAKPLFRREALASPRRTPDRRARFSRARCTSFADGRARHPPKRPACLGFTRALSRLSSVRWLARSWRQPHSMAALAAQSRGIATTCHETANPRAVPGPSTEDPRRVSSMKRRGRVRPACARPVQPTPTMRPPDIRQTLYVPRSSTAPTSDNTRLRTFGTLQRSTSLNPAPEYHASRNAQRG